MTVKMILTSELKEGVPKGTQVLPDVTLDITEHVDQYAMEMFEDMRKRKEFHYDDYYFSWRVYMTGD